MDPTKECWEAEYQAGFNTAGQQKSTFQTFLQHMVF